MGHTFPFRKQYPVASGIESVAYADGIDTDVSSLHRISYKKPLCSPAEIVQSPSVARKIDRIPSLAVRALEHNGESGVRNLLRRRIATRLRDAESPGETACGQLVVQPYDSPIRGSKHPDSRELIPRARKNLREENRNYGLRLGLIQDLLQLPELPRRVLPRRRALHYIYLQSVGAQTLSDYLACPPAGIGQNDVEGFHLH